MNTFIHSGDAGDVILGLPAMIARSGGSFKLILGTKTKVRKGFDEAWANNLISLLRLQPYIDDVWLQRPTDTWNIDCDGFRDRMFKTWIRGKTAMAYLCDELGVSAHGVDARAWLTVDEAAHVDGCPVVVNRTSRYHNPKFPWLKALRKYEGKMVFIGFPDEYDRFVAAYGIKLPYCPTANVLEMARMIAGGRMFLGNQSLAHAVAEGLKVPITLEVSPLYPTCLFRRPGVVNFHATETLPEIPQ